MLHIIKTRPLVFPVLLLLLASCNTFDADYERDNELDPKGVDFNHSKPELFTVNIENENIDIYWEDASNYNDGYIIEKAINDSTQFEPISRLPGDAEHFRDDSGEIGLVVYYRISSFDNKEGEEEIVHSETLSVSVNIISSENIYNPSKTHIELSWQMSNYFADGIMILEKAASDTTFNLVDKIDKTENQSNYQFEYSSPIESFNVDVQIAAFQYSGDSMVPIHQVDLATTINNPQNLEATFINEVETRVEWENSVDFADHYLLTVIYEKNGEEQEIEILAEELPYTVESTMSTGRYQYKLQGIQDADSSAVRIYRSQFYIRVPYLSYSSNDLSAVTLHFEKDENDIQPSVIIVERSTNDNPFEVLAEVSPEKTEYTDNDLNPLNEYSYRIRTLTNEGHEVITLTNKERYAVVDQSAFSYSGPRMRTSDVQFLESNILAIHKGQSEVDFIDLDDLNIINSFKSGNESYYSRISPDGDIFVEIIDGNGLGEYDLNIWDLNTNSFREKIPAALTKIATNNPYPILQFSKDGSMVGSAIDNTEAKIKIWNTDTGEHIHTIERPGEQMRLFRFHPVKDEVLFITDSDIYIYSLVTFQESSHYNITFGNDHWIDFIITQNGEYAYANQSNRLLLFDMKSGERLKTEVLDTYIRRYSTNNDGSKVLIDFSEWRVLYDRTSLKEIYRIKWDQNLGRHIMVLNPMRINSAISFERDRDQESQWNLYLWEEKPVWYMEPERL